MTQNRDKDELTAADMIRKLVEMLSKQSPEANKAFKEKIIKATGHRVWLPTPGPQLLAVESEADEVFFGGSAGGAKTQTLIGPSLTKHQRSLILRRTNKEASKLNDEIAAILGSRDGFNGQESVWRLPDGRTIDIAGSGSSSTGRPGSIATITEIPRCPVNCDGSQPLAARIPRWTGAALT